MNLPQPLLMNLSEGIIKGEINKLRIVPTFYRYNAGIFCSGLKWYNLKGDGERTRAIEGRRRIHSGCTMVNGRWKSLHEGLSCVAFYRH